MKTEKQLPSLNKTAFIEHLNERQQNELFEVLSVLEAHAKKQYDEYCQKSEETEGQITIISYTSYWNGWLDCIKQIKGEKEKAK